MGDQPNQTNSNQPDPKALRAVEEALGYFFSDQGLLETALRHRSFVHQFGGREGEDNQRLEFLGDAVLGLCVSALLFRDFPDLKEGQLSRMRAGLVNESALADLARKIGLSQGLLVGNHGAALGCHGVDGERGSGAMYETDEEVAALQTLLARSFAPELALAANGHPVS